MVKHYEKIQAIILCLVLIISGLLIMNAGASAPETGSRASTRAADPDPNTNDFAPNITLIAPAAPANIWNNNTDYKLLVVDVTDQDINASSGNATSGGNVTGVTVDLSPLSGSATAAMGNDGTNGDVTPNDDRWTYWLTVPTTVAAGTYYLFFNVTDNGTGWNDTIGEYSNGTSMGTWAGFNATIIVDQINRPPEADPNSKIITFDEDMYNNTLDLSIFFSDPDGDTLTYTIDMLGETNVTVDITDPTSVNFTSLTNWFGSADVVITGNDTETDPPGYFTDDLDIHINVNTANDEPMINATGDWMATGASLSGTDEFSGNEDELWTIMAYATDDDMLNPTPDSLDFAVENIADLPAKMDIGTDGMFNFTPTNADVGTYELNVSVTDGTSTVSMNITFVVLNTNDEPALIKIMVGTNSVTIVNNAADLTSLNAATEDEEFTFNVSASDDDADTVLTFAEETTSILSAGNSTDMSQEFSFTPTNDDVGFVIINISVKDGASPDDYVLVNITVDGANDAPMLDKVDGTAVTSGDTIDRGKVTVGDYDNFTIEASDIDMDEVLTGPSDTSAIKITKNGTMWDVSFNPAAGDVGNVTLNFTITDVGLASDYVTITWEVESGEPPIPPNEDPTIGMTTTASTAKMGDTIEIEGTWTDAESDTVTIMMASRTPMDAQVGFTGEPESYEYDVISSLFETITVNADGTWKYTTDTGEMFKAFQEALEALEALLGSAVDDSILYGTYTFYFMVADEDGGESSAVSVSFEIEKKGGDGGDDEKTLSIGLFDYDILILLVIIVVVILIVVMMMKKKKKVEEPAEEAPAGPVSCTACGAEILPGSPTCPACGAAAPAPAIGPVACTACAAEIPAGTPNCPACGAPAPAEAPPVDTICECGATILAGTPTCAACGRPAPAPVPPEGAPMNCAACGNQIPPGSPTCPACGVAAPAPPPAEAPPEGGMPPAEGGMPPAEGAMPPAGAPPEGMAPPPAAPPVQQPPAEGAAPAQMVACPTCGVQIAVGQTPCPGCGTALNWG